MARPPQDPKIRMDEILDAAEPLFSANGYRKTTISDIAQELGVAQGMLYYYFKSKDEILEALINRGLSAFLTVIEKISYSDTISPSDKIELLINTVLQGAYDNGSGHDLLLTFFNDEKRLHISQKILRQALLIFKPCLLKIIKEGIQTKCFYVTHPQTIISFIISILMCLSDALCEKLSDELIVYHLRMAEVLIEKTLGMPEKTLHLSL